MAVNREPKSGYVLPENADCVFSGQFYDVYNWEQELFDTSSETFEALKRRDSVMVLATKGDNILLGHESQPNRSKFYSFFGGIIEEGEEPLIAAKRELLEETGFTTDNWELYKPFPFAGRIQATMFLFIARNVEKVQEPQLDAGEDIAVLELSIDEFFDVIANPEFRVDNFALDMFRQLYTNKNFKEEFKAFIFGEK